jgi:hypothetical protein
MVCDDNNGESESQLMLAQRTCVGKQTEESCFAKGVPRRLHQIVLAMLFGAMLILWRHADTLAPC